MTSARDANPPNARRNLTISQVRRWWHARGGWRDFICSPYAQLALLLMVPTAHFWCVGAWWELVTSILPNVIGFSLGGYAILLAFGDEKFKRLLVAPVDDRDAGGPTDYLSVSAIFLHFILMQLLALFVGVIAKTMDFSIAESLSVAMPRAVERVLCIGRCVWGAVGFFLFLYSLALAAAAALSVFGLSETMDEYMKHSAGIRQNEQSGELGNSDNRS